MAANSDFKELLNLFEDCEVRYLVVGGYAVMHYCEPRYTKDLDIWVDASSGNAQNVFKALARFGAPLKGISPADFATEGLVYQMGVPPVRVDVIMSLDGVGFEDAWQSRERGEFEGSPVWFIGREHLIRNKTASGRHIDLHDVEQLRLRRKRQS
jgi:hypothetical protein